MIHSDSRGSLDNKKLLFTALGFVLCSPGFNKLKQTNNYANKRFIFFNYSLKTVTATKFTISRWERLVARIKGIIKTYYISRRLE